MTLAEVAGLIILLIVFVVIVFRALVSTRPSPDREGLSWSHKELLDSLKARGLDLKVVLSAPGDHSFDPIVFAAKDQLAVMIVLKPNAQAAKDFAGACPHPAFSWGRFAFVCGNSPADKELLAEIQKALN